MATALKCVVVGVVLGGLLSGLLWLLTPRILYDVPGVGAQHEMRVSNGACEVVTWRWMYRHYKNHAGGEDIHPYEQIVARRPCYDGEEMDRAFVEAK
jgi:hypothetical protein